MGSAKADDLINDWLIIYAKSTKETYGGITKRFFESLDISDIKGVSQNGIDHWLNIIKADSHNTQHTKIETIKSFFNYLYERKETSINLADMVQSLKIDRNTKGYLIYEEFIEMINLAKTKNDNDYHMIMSIYLDALKSSQVAKIFKISRPTVNKRIRKYHPIATPEMIKNSLEMHSKSYAIKCLGYVERKEDGK